MSNIVYIKQNRCWTNSKKLAESFGKRHDNVLRDIRSTISDLQDPDFIALNFEFKEIKTLRGTTETEYCELTQDAFTLVAFGFAGKKAMAFKKVYIEEFNRMRSELEMRGQPTLSTEELLQRALDEIKTQKEIAAKAIREKGQISSSREASCMAKVGVANRKIRVLETKLGISENWKSAAGWLAELPQLKAISDDPKVIGKHLKQVSLTLGHAIETIPDPRWGKVNSYNKETVLNLLSQI